MSDQVPPEKPVKISQSQFQFEEDQPQAEQYDSQSRSSKRSSQNSHSNDQQNEEQRPQQITQQQHEQYNFDEPVAEEISSISKKSSDEDPNQISQNPQPNSQIVPQPSQSQQRPDLQESSDMCAEEKERIEYPSLSENVYSEENNPITVGNVKAQQLEQQVQNESSQVSKPLQKQKQQNVSQLSSGLKKQQQVSSKPENRALIQLAENDQLAEVKLSKSSRDQEPIRIEFLRYEVAYFLKIETQIFIIQVINEKVNAEPYLINRRFSDFLFLFEAISINHLGYILYPFPSKTMDTFLKLKLNLNNQSEGEKLQLIEQRMAELSKFTRFILSHRELRNSDQIRVFLSPDENYEKDKKMIESFVEEYKQLQTHSNLKNIMGKSINFIRSYLRKQEEDPKQYKAQTISKKELEFGVYLQTVQKYSERIGSLLQIIQQLLNIQKEFSCFTDIETDIDLLLKLCAKHSSGKQYARFLIKWVENDVLDGLGFRARQLKQIEGQLLYRVELEEIAKELAGKPDQKQQYEKIRRRINRFEINFRNSWGQFFSAFKKDYQRQVGAFKTAWTNYQGKMKQIWKRQ